MTTHDEIKRLIRQTRQYEFTDGLRDMQLAVLFASVGITGWFVMDFKFIPLLQSLMHTLGPTAAWLMLIIVFVPALLGFAMLWVIKQIRRRWLWRESGMVEPGPIAIPHWIFLVAAALYILSLVIAIRYTSRDVILQMVMVAGGWSTGVMLFGLALNTGIKRYTWIGIIGILLSCLPILLKQTFGQTTLWIGLSWGALFFISGIVALLRYGSRKEGQ